MVIKISNRELNGLISTPTERKHKHVGEKYTPEKRRRRLPESRNAFDEVSGTPAKLQNSPARHTAKHKFDDEKGTLGKHPTDAKVKRISAWIEELSRNTNTANPFEPIPPESSSSTSLSDSTSLSSSIYNSCLRNSRHPWQSNLQHTKRQLQRLSPDLDNPERTAVFVGKPKPIIKSTKIPEYVLDVENLLTNIPIALNRSEFEAGIIHETLKLQSRFDDKPNWVSLVRHVLDKLYILPSDDQGILLCTYKKGHQFDCAIMLDSHDINPHHRRINPLEGHRDMDIVILGVNIEPSGGASLATTQLAMAHWATEILEAYRRNLSPQATIKIPLVGIAVNSPLWLIYLFYHAKDPKFKNTHISRGPYIIGETTSGRGVSMIIEFFRVYRHWFDTKARPWLGETLVNLVTDFQ